MCFNYLGPEWNRKDFINCPMAIFSCRDMAQNKSFQWILLLSKNSFITVTCRPMLFFKVVQLLSMSLTRSMHLFFLQSGNFLLTNLTIICSNIFALFAPPCCYGALNCTLPTCCNAWMRYDFVPAVSMLSWHPKTVHRYLPAICFKYKIWDQTILLQNYSKFMV